MNEGEGTGSRRRRRRKRRSKKKERQRELERGGRKKGGGKEEKRTGKWGRERRRDERDVSVLTHFLITLTMSAFWPL